LDGQVICAHLLEEKKQQVAPKRWYLSATLHSIKPQKTAFLKPHLRMVFRYSAFTISTGA